MYVLKTIVIWDSCGQESIKFFTLDGDRRDLNQVYINACENQDGQKRLNKVLAYDKHGKPKVTLLDEFPIVERVDYVIVAGFMP